MKKLYTTILLISLALFLSCDEKKAKDEITKAIEKSENETENVADKTTPKPKGSGTLMNIARKPALSGKLVPWSEPILFPKIPEHTYTLKEKKTGVAITEYSSETMQVTATQSAQNVIIIATLDGDRVESDPIEFTRIPGNTLSFKQSNIATFQGYDVRQAASKSGLVTGDKRKIRYTIAPGGNGVTVNANSGDIEIAEDATYRIYTVTAELPQDEKYTRSIAQYTIEVVTLSM